MAHLLFGLIMVALGLWGVVAWWGLFGLVMRGVVPFFLLVLGLVAIIAGCRNGSAGRRCETTDAFVQDPGRDASSSTAAKVN